MKRIFILFGFCLVFWQINAQYTWERSHTGTTGGHQQNSSYSITTAVHGYEANGFQNSTYSGNVGFLHPELHTLPPVIQSITDVPNDQGKQVQMVWNRSDYDDIYSPEKFYSLWRMDDTESFTGTMLSHPLEVIQDQEETEKDFFWLSDGEVWTYIDTVPALNFAQYSAVAPTLFDSITGIDGYSIFKVVFHDLYAYYESSPDSGYSVDNLAPLVPALAAQLNGTVVDLTWTHCIEPDFQHYALYKSDDPVNFPLTPFYSTIDTSYSDPELISDTVYYVMTAFDHNGNESQMSNVVEVTGDNAILVNLKVYLEGPFNGSDMNTSLNPAELPLAQPYWASPWSYAGGESVPSVPNPDVTDWILVELRDAPSAASATEVTMIARQAGFLLDDGSVVGTDGASMLSFDVSVSQSLFAVVWHRNHLGVLSANSLTESGGVYSYDFSSDANQVYGGMIGHKELSPGVWGMVAADGNADGQVDNSDKNMVWSQQAGGSGYLSGDFNLDAQVDNSDKNVIWIPNSGSGGQVPDGGKENGYESQVPE